MPQLFKDAGAPRSSQMRLAVADECGTEFRDQLTTRLDTFGIEVLPLDGSPATAAVVGGREAAADVAMALRAGVSWIQTLTAGVERVRPHLGSAPVQLTNASAATARPVSEFAMARVLEHAKQLPRLAAQQRERHWETRWLGALHGSVMTVVGLGPIGSRVASLAKAFGMEVIGIRRSPVPHDWCDETLGPEGLVPALARSEYCVLAPALTNETRRMISAATLAHAKQGLFLVNVGRGELIDDDDLMASARAGHVEAALDVFEQEPLPADSPLWDTPGITVSSHTATLTPPLIGWLVELVAANAIRFSYGEPLDSVVDLDLGYPAR